MIRNSLIFLDWDGCISVFKKAIDETVAPQIWTPETMKAYGLNLEYTEACLRRFMRIQEATNAGVIFTSSWRIGTEAYWLGLKYELMDMGIRKVLGRTPYLPHSNRLEEIKLWLAEHKYITNFIIIDDAYDFGELENRRIHTNHEYGLIEQDVQLAIKLLNGEKK